MSGRLWITVFLLASLLVFSGGCSKRRKMIEQQQAQIARCEGEIADVTADEGWRKERDSFVESLSLEKQETDLHCHSPSQPGSALPYIGSSVSVMKPNAAS